MVAETMALGHPLHLPRGGARLLVLIIVLELCIYILYFSYFGGRQKRFECGPAAGRFTTSDGDRKSMRPCLYSRSVHDNIPGPWNG